MHNKLILSAVIAAGLVMVGTGTAAAQDHVVVPLSHPSQPATLKVTTLNGSITVRAYSGRDIVIDSAGGSGRRHEDENPPAEAQGMHRLNTGGGLEATEDNNVVTVHTSVMGGGENVTIQVPANTSVNLHSVNGSRIEVDGTTGDVSVDCLNGRVTLDNVSGSVVASAQNGRIDAALARLDPTKPSSFSSMNGRIDITLPADVHADLQLKTTQGNIYMDDGFNFQQQMTPGAAQSEREGSGMYRIRVDNTIQGKLNGGGPQLRVQNFNGNIYIRKAH